jgi:hypothetical protein
MTSIWLFNEVFDLLYRFHSTAPNPKIDERLCSVLALCEEEARRNLPDPPRPMLQ